MSTLHIFRGLPGSGKSTAARKLAEETGAILIEPDMLLVQDGKYNYGPKRFGKAQNTALVLISAVAHRRADIIYADVLPCRYEVCIIQNWAQGYKVIVHDLKITPEESKARNRHNVQPEDIDRMAREWEDWE